MFSKELSQELQNLVGNISQDQQLAYHKKHIQALWKHIERLEQFIEVSSGGSVAIKVGNAAIVMKRNGEITIKGHDINIEGFGNIRLRAASNVVIKGDKILQN
jgi:hypothetical protein